MRKSSVKARSAGEASLVFVDASEMRDAFTPVGLYTVSGEKVIINLNLIQNDLLVGTMEVEGTVANEASKAALLKTERRW